MMQKKRRKKSFPAKRKKKGYGKRILKKIRSVITGTTVFLSICLMVFGGYDFYQNGNVERTCRLIGEAYENAQEIARNADQVIREGERRIRELIQTAKGETLSASLESLPEYCGEPYVILNNDVPDFEDGERSSGTFEYYSELDSLGRCGRAEAMVTRELMPTQERGAIGSVKPTGWHTVKYDTIADRYLYNRCHLIAYELSGENANEKNLITGTRYMNVSGMLPWENKVAQYVRKTGDRVLYRVTPVFYGTELVARGVQMEAESMGSSEIRFNIFVYNVQPGIEIDYASGDSRQKEEE